MKVPAGASGSSQGSSSTASSGMPDHSERRRDVARVVGVLLRDGVLNAERAAAQRDFVHAPIVPGHAPIVPGTGSRMHAPPRRSAGSAGTAQMCEDSAEAGAGTRRPEISSGVIVM